MNKKDLDALAAADALRSLSGHRHQARWEALGLDHQPGLFEGLEPEQEEIRLEAPAEAENIVADYEHTGLSLRRHPLALLRTKFKKMGWLSSNELLQSCHNMPISLVGLTINRQHPGSAKGTIFLTLEDEFGTSNIVIWPKITAQYTKEVVHGRLLLVEGHIEREGEVIHVVARRLRDFTHWLGELKTSSRDFH